MSSTNTGKSKQATCKGKTLQNKSCKNKPKKGLEYCYRHLPLELQVKTDENEVKTKGECTICLEVVDLLTLTCGHMLHLECARSMISAACPICRFPLTEADLDSETLEFIRENQGEFKEECIADEQEVIRRELNERRSTEPSISDRISTEIVFTMGYLRRLGIPMRYFPVDIVINFDPLSPRPEFSHIVIASVIQDLVDTVGDELEFCSNCGLLRGRYDDDDDCDPFESENDELMTEQRRVEVRPIV